MITRTRKQSKSSHGRSHSSQTSSSFTCVLHSTIQWETQKPPCETAKQHCASSHLTLTHSISTTKPSEEPIPRVDKRLLMSLECAFCYRFKNVAVDCSTKHKDGNQTSRKVITFSGRSRCVYTCTRFVEEIYEVEQERKENV